MYRQHNLTREKFLGKISCLVYKLFKYLQKDSEIVAPEFQFIQD